MMPQRLRETPSRRIRIATYNVHGWIGIDNRQVPMRAMRVISELEADIIALQEATFSLEYGGHLDETFFTNITGMETALGPTFFKRPFHFGNVLLSRFPFTRIRTIDLSAHPYEPRGAIDAVIRIGDRNLRVLTAHFGLKRSERKFQADMIIRALTSRPLGNVVLMGDFNEWSPINSSLDTLYALFAKTRHPKSFPSFCPMFSLDRILVSPEGLLEGIDAFTNPETILASDHLPITGIISL
ncbi:MAG TPA: endonuclease/exonuclease/phosphatase family protein [Deltaproteobacteria bacterium]|jgi:endonuclease/exonuclease/phosphatase family metal-dependent hydrolase|nr:endonuclease/exonuclease/phosphatase family protein [Deltaproteobacteria bacterium]HQI01334.1 endonuclease/exonuclease/phosphatase family protein [Deltaproteobacteria bacterium]HQJ07728.1 endonuclease/exonuclease/phosphatase family protein [Deltaproteobacteria bacterium]